MQCERLACGGSTTNAPTSEGSSEGLDSWEVRRVRSDVAADPNYRFRVDSEGADPHDSAPNPLAMFFGSNLVANCADYNGSAGSSGY